MGGISVVLYQHPQYRVSSDTSVTSIDQLKGKTVYLTGKGTTPEYSLRYLMSAAGLQRHADPGVQIRALRQVAVLAEDPSRIGLLSPSLLLPWLRTKAFSVVLDLTKAWDEAQEQAEN